MQALAAARNGKPAAGWQTQTAKPLDGPSLHGYSSTATSKLKKQQQQGQMQSLLQLLLR
jgi:hypothetical protein